jgi:hypothetical protein
MAVWSVISLSQLALQQRTLMCDRKTRRERVRKVISSQKTQSQCVEIFIVVGLGGARDLCSDVVFRQLQLRNGPQIRTKSFC